MFVGGRSNGELETTPDLAEGAALRETVYFSGGTVATGLGSEPNWRLSRAMMDI